VAQKVIDVLSQSIEDLFDWYCDVDDRICDGLLGMSLQAMFDVI
jgi:hypothetical protein